MLAIRFAALMRWLHIYLSMFGLASVLFFSVTGLTLNHPDWFFAGAERRVEAEGRIDPKWLHLDTPAPSSGRSRSPTRLAGSPSWRSSNTCGGPTASAVPWRNSGPKRPNAW